VRVNGAADERAKRLRRNSTDAERLMWAHLRGRRLAGYKFKRQVPIAGYVVDFVALEAKLIVEIDGGQHSIRIEEDRVRTEELERFGYRIVRFWNHDVLNNIEGVLEALVQELHIIR
jgi:very-short-patch-repair endonuclease